MTSLFGVIIRIYPQFLFIYHLVCILAYQQCVVIMIGVSSAQTTNFIVKLT